MTLSSFLLALYIFLQSVVSLGWFSVDSKLVGFVGIAFVTVFVIEVLLGFSGRKFTIFDRRTQV